MNGVNNYYTSNKFLQLISTPHIKLYSQYERQSLAMIINSDKIYKQLLPEILTSAEKHIKMRVNAVVKRAFLSTGSRNLEINRVVEAFSDSHFRKQRHKGPTKEEIAQKVTIAYNNHESINLVGLMFTRKNICPLKRGGGDESMTDLAEIVSLVHLNSFAALIDKFYPWGVKFTILSEGKRLTKAFDYTPERALIYQNNLREWIDLLNLKYLNIYDYNDFLQGKLSSCESEARQDSYNEVLETYQKLMSSILNPNNMAQTLKRAIILDPKDDTENSEKNFVPVWKSILNSLPYLLLQEYANEIGGEYDHVYLDMMRNIFSCRKNKKEENLRQHIIEKSWKATIEHNAQEMGDAKAKIDPSRLINETAFRTTINPKLGSQLGIYSIRQTVSCVHPWHGTGFLQTDHSGRLVATALSKLELESMLAIPIYVNKDNNQPFCYATKTAANILKTSDNIIFNMSTRL